MPPVTLHEPLQWLVMRDGELQLCPKIIGHDVRDVLYFLSSTRTNKKCKRKEKKRNKEHKSLAKYFSQSNLERIPCLLRVTAKGLGMKYAAM